MIATLSSKTLAVNALPSLGVTCLALSQDSGNSCTTYLVMTLILVVHTICIFEVWKTCIVIDLISIGSSNTQINQFALQGESHLHSPEHQRLSNHNSQHYCCWYLSLFTSKETNPLPHHFYAQLLSTRLLAKIHGRPHIQCIQSIARFCQLLADITNLNTHSQNSRIPFYWYTKNAWQNNPEISSEGNSHHLE